MKEQQEQFAEEMVRLKQSKPTSKSSRLHLLSPILDAAGIERLNGGMKNSNMDEKVKFPFD